MDRRWRHPGTSLSLTLSLVACLCIGSCKRNAGSPLFEDSGGAQRPVLLIPSSAWGEDVPSKVQLYRRSLAVVVGIDRYAHLPRLEAAERDAREVARALQARGFRVRTFLGPEATRDRIASALGDELHRIAHEDDRLIVYFAGHGVSVGEGHAQVGYLMPVGGDPERPAATGIAMTEVVRWFGRYRARHVMFLADACYSGLALSSRAVGLRPAMERYLQAITTRRARVALVAGGAGEQANEWVNEGRRQGLFTHYLLRALDGAADANGDCVITSDEIVAYVKPEVSKQAQLLWGAEQHPQSGRSGEGELIFLTAPGGDGKGCKTPITAHQGATMPHVAASSPLERPHAEVAALPPAAATPTSRPEIAIPRRAVYPDVDLAVEQLLDEALALQVDRDARAATVRQAWCALAAHDAAAFYGPQAREACAQWRRHERFAQTGEQAAQAEYRRLLGYLALRHLDRAQRIEAVQRYLALFAGQAETGAVRAAAGLLKTMQSREAVKRLALDGAARPDANGPAARLQTDLPEGWVRIAPGRFTMGTAPDERPRDPDERQRQAQVRRPFLMMRHEVTQQQWRAVLGTNPSTFAGCGAECPVEEVTFWDALAYCNARSQAEGLPQCYALEGCDKPGAGALRCRGATFSGTGCLGYRLPTDEEWEYAARAGTRTATYAGELKIPMRRTAPSLDAIAWHGGHNEARYAGAMDCSDWAGRARPVGPCGTNPVGRLKPNAWGLHDMIGNVWEWVWSGEVPGEGTGEGSARVEAPRRVARGGGWYNDARDCRAANRFVLSADAHYFNLGLRLVRTVAPTEELQ